MERNDFIIGETYHLKNRLSKAAFKGKLHAKGVVSGRAIFKGKDQNKVDCHLSLDIVCDPKRGWEKA